MPATATSRIDGVTTSVAVKSPCKAVTTTAVVMNGEQTVGGVACVTGDRVLVAITGGSGANGIWVVDTGDWSRAKDFDGARDVVQGTLVLVAPGTTSARLWQVTTPGAITPGTTAIAFSQLDPSSLYADAAQIIYNSAGSMPAGTVAAKLREWPSLGDSLAVGDGATDDSAKFAAQVAATPAGGALYLSPGKVYLLNSFVTIDKAMVIYGFGATIKLGPSFNAGGTNTLQALLVTANDVTISAVKFDATTAVAESNNNRFIWFTGSRGRVSDCRFKSLPSTGANVNCAVGFASGANYGSLTESYFEDCPGAGFSQGIGTRMTDNTVINPKDVSFALNGVACVGGVISDNTIDNASSSVVSGHIAVEEGASKFTITGNTMSGVKDGFGIGCINVAVFIGGDGGLIDGNTVDGKSLTTTNPSSLISVSKYYSNVVISDNTMVNGCAGSSGNTIMSVGAKNNVVKGNRINSGSSATGLCVYFDAGGGTVEFDSNSVTFNGTGACVTFNGNNSNEPAIVRTNFFRNASVGIVTGGGTNFPLYHENNAFPSVTNPLSGTSHDAYFNTHGAWQWPHRVMYGHAEMYGNAIPSGGAWRQGDSVHNVAPTAGGVPGWRCTADGSPGTWKAMANLAA